MTNHNAKSIIEAVFAKYMPPLRKQIFHTGVIVLVGLLTGLAVFEFADLPPTISEQDAHVFRRAWGLMSGVSLSVMGLLVYFVWLIARGLRARKQAIDLITKAAIERHQHGH